MNIRKATRNDIATMQKIYKEVDEEDASYIVETLYDFRSKLSQDFVLEVNREIIGFSGFAKDGTCTKDTFWLNWTAIRKDKQGQGYGKNLLIHVEQHAKEQGCRKLFVMSSSKDNYATSRMFYEAMGFVYEATLQDYYQKGEDAICFGKNL